MIRIKITIRIRIYSRRRLVSFCQILATLSYPAQSDMLFFVGQNSPVDGGNPDLCFRWIATENRMANDTMRHGPERKEKTRETTERPPQDQDRYRQLAEQLPAITYIVEIRPFPHTVYISPQVLPLLGFTQEEWLAETEFWIRHLDPRDCERIMDTVRQHNQTGEPFFLEYRVRAKDGRGVWLRNSATYQRDNTGRPVAVHGVMLDITERKLAEERLNTLTDCLLGFGSDATANINRLVATCGSTMDAVCGLYNRIDDGLLCSLGQWQAPAGFQATDNPEGHICYDVIRQADDQPVVIRNLPATSYARTDRNVAAYGLQTYIGVAVKCHDRALGSLCVVYQRDVEPSLEQLDFMRIVAFAIAIEEERKRAEQELQQGHELLSLFICHSPVYAYIKEVTPTESRVLQASENFEQMVGIPGSKMVGKTMAELFPADLAAKITADDWAVVSKGDVLKVDEDLNGRHYTTIKYPIVQGRKTLLAGYTLDITERRQSEAALRERETNYFDLFNTVKQAIYIQNPDSTFIIVNQGAVDMYGYAREEFVGKTPEFLAAPGKNDFGQIAAILDRAFRGEPQKFEFWGRRKDGSIFPKDVWTVKGKYFGKDVLISLANDITERKRAEAKLRENEKLLGEAQAIAGLGSYALHIQTGKWESSDMLDTLFGIDRAYEHTVAGWEALLHPDDRARMMEYFQNEVVGQGRPFDKEYRIIRGDNRAVRWVHGLGRLEFDGRRNPVKMIGTIQDITGRKEAETEKALLEADLHQAQKMESVGRLAGGVAHDFNNILQAIMGNVELALEQTKPDDPIHHDLLEVQNASRRAADLIRQLLAFARKQTVAPRTIDLNQTVENMLKMLRRLIGEEVQLVWTPAADLWPVRMDPSQTDQILANLCVNARDAMGGTGEIQIETKNTHVDELNALRHEGFSPGDYVLLMVSDTGCGMGKDTQDRIFEPFFTTKDMGKGTGLGLSTVYGIVRQNQGHIAVYSEVGKGTIFRIYLPRLMDAAAEPVEEVPAKPITRGCETLLLVEDDPAILKLTARIIEQQGYTVLAANTPGEALRLAQEHDSKIDLLLTDIVMPGMNGRELSERLRTRQPGLKCLFMSGYTANVIARQGMLEAGVHFIQKPFSMADLDAKIRAVLGVEA
jgi:two-component system, cell cycle sensor histidine kinase and response regulator CckA